jgi:hypothetical protein
MKSRHMCARGPGILVLVGVLVVPIRGRAEDGADVIARARVQATRVIDKSMHVTVRMEGTGGGLSRSLTGYEKQTAEGRKILWVFESPAALAGTSFLAWQRPHGAHQLWVYFPAQRRVRQVADQLGREHFQGGQFTYEDLTTVFYFDYAGTHWLEGERPCEGGTCWVVDTQLEPGRFAYTRLVTWLRRDDYVPARIEFYDRTLQKTVRVLRSGMVGDIPTILTMEAEGAGDHNRTVIEYTDVRCNTGLRDDLFTLGNLAHGK